MYSYLEKMDRAELEKLIIDNEKKLRETQEEIMNLKKQITDIKNHKPAPDKIKITLTKMLKLDNELLIKILQAEIKVAKVIMSHRRGEKISPTSF